MPEEPNPGWNEQPQSRLSLVVTMTVLLVLYPLSIGPAAGLVFWLGHSTPAGQNVNKVITVFYRPLVWAAENSPFLIRRLEIYVGWFGP